MPTARREVEVEAGATSVIAPPGGFSRDDLAEETVTVIGPGSRKPDSLLLGRELYKQDGTYYPLNIGSRSTRDFGDAVAASSLEGTWFLRSYR